MIKFIYEVIFYETSEDCVPLSHKITSLSPLTEKEIKNFIYKDYKKAEICRINEEIL